jgi:hypothetical protein
MYLLTNSREAKTFSNKRGAYVGKHLAKYQAYPLRTCVICFHDSAVFEAPLLGSHSGFQPLDVLA